jgi:glutathionylspermidine synthase
MISEPWNINGTEFSELLKTLQFDYFKWDTYAAGGLKLIPESIVLGKEEHSEIVYMTERVSRILAVCEEAIVCSEVLQKKLSIPQAVLELMKYEKSTSLQLARYDFFKTPDGSWQLSEFNEDVPGGFNEIIAIETLHEKLHTGSRGTEKFSSLFLESIPEHGKVACMYATGYSEDLQHMLVLKKLLEERGQEVLLCAPSHLQYRFFSPRVFGEKISSVVRFYPAEWFQYLPNTQDWKRSLPMLSMMSPLRRLLRQSKKLFCIWDEIACLNDDDRNFIKSVTPESYEYSSFSRSRLQNEKPDWVIKHAFGRMGDAVCMGSLVSDAEWTQVISEADRSPDSYLVQKKFDVVPVEFSKGLQYPALGAFVISGRFAGYYSRIHPIPFLTHEASYVPTVVSIS